MGKLKVLPAQIANMIAAGEVVQRPASVVKELMENGIDAGASAITVVLTDAGRTLIQVIDNGCGMSPSDAVLCFERHATSKISSAEDLEAILTYGFRGEALASVAAVAEVTLKTRARGATTGTRVRVSSSGKTDSSEAAMPEGSNFEVRNLFYNTPARRKFLKSDAAELRHCIEEFTRVAIIRPDIEFSLKNNGKDIFVLKKSPSLKFRILDLLGTNVTGELVDVNTQTSTLRVSGFIGRPDSARKVLGNQFFFINGRYFRSPYLHKAVMNAYEEMIPDGVTPSYFLFLETDPRTVDVNIHPTKSEVKFEDESIVFQIIYACIKEVLGRNSFGADIDFDTEGTVELPQIGGSLGEFKGDAIAPALDFDPYYDPFNPKPAPAQNPGKPFSAGGAGRFTDRRDNYGALFEERPSEPQSRTVILDGKYIISPGASGLMVVNIRRARERILFERFLSAFQAGEKLTQVSLFPVQIQVGAAAVTLFEDNSDILQTAGFDISPFGTDTIVVNGVPDGFDCSQGKVESLVRDISVILSEETGSLQEVLQSNLASRFAAAGAARSDAPSSVWEAQQLLGSLFACGNSEVTASGKRIVYLIPTSEIDKKF